MPEEAGGGGGKKKTNRKVWVIGGVGSVVAYLAWKAHQASVSNAAATGLQGGTTIPAVGSTVTGTSAAPAPTSLAAWVQQALGSSTTAGYQSPALLNDINSWLNGTCVSQNGYNVIGQLVETLGVPPGYQIPPSLSVCASTPATPPPGTAGGSTSSNEGSSSAATGSYVAPPSNPAPSGSPTPAPASSGSPAPAAPSPGVTGAMFSALDSAVGALSSLVGRGSTPAQLAAAQQQAAAGHLDYTTTRLFEQEQNIGVVSSGLKTPSVATIVSRAASLAGGASAYQGLTSDQQRYYNDLANTQLLTEMNPKK